MSEIIIDSTLQFIIVALIGIVAIIVAATIYFKQRQRKNISFEVLSNSSLLSVEDEIKKDVQILYKGKLVEQVNLILLRLVNSGNVPVVSADFEGPIMITLENDTLIYSAEIVNKKPKNLSVSISSEESRVALAPTLLNPKDSMMVRMLVTKSSGIKVDGRIAGVSKIQEVSRDRGTLGTVGNLVIGGTTGASIIAALTTLIQGPSSTGELFLIALGLPIVLISITIFIGKLRSL